MMTKEDALREAGVPIEPEVTQSQTFMAVLKTLGYNFRLNLCDDSIEVNGRPLSDITAAQIRMEMRDRQVKNMAAVEDAYMTEAGRNAYHPVRDYLYRLKDAYESEPKKVDWFSLFASHIQDDNEPVKYDDGSIVPLSTVYLYRWMLGAVAKVIDRKQNPMLVWDGSQGLGKSNTVKFLCPLEGYYIEGPINVQDKDSDVRLISKWIWEVSELDATTRKADVAALKAFITKDVVTVRKAYGRNDIVKPALASLFGTVNNSTGFLADETGSRRFYVCHITKINWNYTALDPRLIWGQMVSRYLEDGEQPSLTDEERVAQRLTNQRYEVETPLEDWLMHYFTLTNDPDDSLSMGEIVMHLADKGIRLSGGERVQSMEIGRILQRMGVKKHHTRMGKRWIGITRAHST